MAELMVLMKKGGEEFTEVVNFSSIGWLKFKLSMKGVYDVGKVRVKNGSPTAEIIGSVIPIMSITKEWLKGTLVEDGGLQTARVYAAGALSGEKNNKRKKRGM